MFYGRVVSSLLFSQCGFMAYGLRSVVHMNEVLWSQVCCSLDVLWSCCLRSVVHLKIYGLRSVVHLMFYGRVVSGLFTCDFMAYGLRPVAHLKIYGLVVSGLLFT